MNQSRRSPPAFTGESGRPARHGLDHSELLSHRDAAAVLTVQIKPKGIFFLPPLTKMKYASQHVSVYETAAKVEGTNSVLDKCTILKR